VRTVRKVRGLTAVRLCYAIMPPSVLQRRTAASSRKFQTALVIL